MFGFPGRCRVSSSHRPIDVGLKGWVGGAVDHDSNFNNSAVMKVGDTEPHRSPGGPLCARHGELTHQSRTWCCHCPPLEEAETQQSQDCPGTHSGSVALTTFWALHIQLLVRAGRFQTVPGYSLLPPLSSSPTLSPHQETLLVLCHPPALHKLKFTPRLAPTPAHTGRPLGHSGKKELEATHSQQPQAPLGAHEDPSLRGEGHSPTTTWNLLRT